MFNLYLSFWRSTAVTGVFFLPALVFSSLSSEVHSQVVTPPVTFNGSRDSSIPIQATQAWMNIDLEGRRTRGKAVLTTGMHYPKDSLLVVAVQRAQAWVTRLQTAPVKGLQIDPYGVIAVMAKQEAVAEQQIAERLAAPGLSLTDRALALQMAVVAFASSDYPARLPVAEKYLQQLDALGPEAAFWQFNARKGLVYHYYRLGKSQDIIRVGTRMFELVSAIPFYLRNSTVYVPSISFEYGAIIDALSGQPNGRATIRALNNKLLAGTVPPPEFVAQDSSFFWSGHFSKELMQSMVNVSERVGEQGTPIVANYWLNRGATRDSQMVSVTDGKIHIIEVGHFTCGPCIAAVSGLNRLQAKYPNVDFTWLTWTLGVWGNRIVEPKTESDSLAEHFLNNLKAKVSIGIAYAPRDSTEEGLWVPQVATKMWDKTEYPQGAKPTFYILDGKGMIRRVILGYARDLEENMSGIIEFLQREARTKDQQITRLNP